MKEAALLPDVQLQPHQQRISSESAEHPIRKLLLHGLGTGKSLSGLAAAEAQGRPFTVGVPASLRENYRKEINRFTDKQTPSDILSYTALAQGKPVDKTHTLVFDEAQRLRNPESKATQRAMSLSDQAHQVLLLSGTPIVNRPGDLAVPISMLTGKRTTPEEFEARYSGTKQVSPGILRRLLGASYREEPTIDNRDELKALLQGHVDYYSPDKPVVPVRQEDHEVEMSTPQTRLYKAMWGQLPWLLKRKLKHDIALSPDELRRALSFMTGPRQVGLSTYPYLRNKDPQKAFDQSTKLQKAFGLMQETLQDPRKKGLVFSSFIDAGLTPYAAALQRAGIPHGVFHGGLSDDDRKNLVNDYNSNKLRVALLGPSGTEGLSFKGTNLVQLLDQHFQSTRGRQAVGRGLRFDSHLDLPEDLKNVTVQRFISKLPLGFKDQLLSSLGFDRSHNQRGTDDYLRTMSARKDRENQQFVDLLREVGTPKQAAANFRKLDSPQALLQQAKAYSDKQEWPGKHAILLKLMTERPQDWHIDSDLNNRFVGVTHQTGWRYHMPKDAVPPTIRRLAQV